VSFRDQESQDLARQLGFMGRSRVFPDNAYCFEVEAVDVPTKGSKKPIVGIGPMSYPFDDLLKHPSNAQTIEDELIGKIATFASLIAKSYSISLFGSDIRNDPSVIEELRGVLLDRHHISLPEYIPVESVSELLTRMSEMDYIVTCRLHGVVLAHLLNKPVLAIAHHPKVMHLMGALGLSEYCVDMRTFDPIQLANRFQSLVANTEAVKDRMASALGNYRAKLTVQFDELFPSAGLNTWTSKPVAVANLESETAWRSRF